MAKKDDDNPFDFSKMMSDFWKAYDPDKVKEMFDPQKFMDHMQAITPKSADVSAVIDRNRRNFDAMVEANKTAATTYRDMIKKQMDIYNRMTAAARDYADAMEKSGNADAKASTEAYTKAVETAFSLMQEMAKETQAATEEAHKKVSAQLETIVKDMTSGKA